MSEHKYVKFPPLRMRCVVCNGSSTLDVASLRCGDCQRIRPPLEQAPPGMTPQALFWWSVEESKKIRKKGGGK